MDIADIISTEFASFDAYTPVSKLAGAFEDPTLKAVVVTDGGEFEGLITRKQLEASHRHPQQKARSIVWPVPTVERYEDVREVARLMIGGDTLVLPVVANDEVVGVVTADAMLRKVQPFLSVLTVDDVATWGVTTISENTTLGEALHQFRENRVTHLPVVDGGNLTGMLSLSDVIDFTTRDVARSQGGSPRGFDEHGGAGARAGYRSHGGFGERGETDRLLDLPVRDVLTAPVATIEPSRPLDEAVGEMFDRGTSSLVVTRDGRADGIVTKTDVLESLTWTDRARSSVQVFGIELLDDISYDEVSDMIDDVARKYGDMTVLEAKVHLHEHDETYRGLPLILARIRLYTDRGYFVAQDEGFGASHALHLARNALEREVLKGKTYGRTKKHPDEDYWSKMQGWWLTGD